MPSTGPMATLDTATKAPLLGSYHLEGSDTLTFTRGHDYLLASIEGRLKAGLLPFSATRFYIPLSSTTASITAG